MVSIYVPLESGWNIHTEKINIHHRTPKIWSLYCGDGVYTGNSEIGTTKRVNLITIMLTASTSEESPSENKYFPLTWLFFLRMNDKMNWYNLSQWPKVIQYHWIHPTLFPHLIFGVSTWSFSTESIRNPKIKLCFDGPEWSYSSRHSCIFLV